MMEYWNAGILEYQMEGWNTGMLEYWEDEVKIK
jgi:hypothetical protein